MKVTRLSAQDVHGYLKLEVEFNSDLTFLTGLNGSGKTSALKLLVALLTPSPEEFAATSFSSAQVSVMEGASEVTIAANKTNDGITLRIDTVDHPLVLSSSDLQFMIDSRRREEHRGAREEAFSPIQEKIVKHPVYCAIRDLSTPMFLGLDRRLLGPGWLREDAGETRRRDFMMRRMLRDDEMIRGSTIDAGLADVNYLVLEKMQEIRAAQERLDERLRQKFFTRAFEYKPSDYSTGNKLPSREELERYRKSLTTIERAAEGLRLPVPELKSALSDFLERMTVVVKSLEESAKKSAGKKGSRKGGSSELLPEKFDDNFLEWIINKPQSDRILEHLALLDGYVSSRRELHGPIDKFVNLINSFLDQTRKRVAVADSGELEVWLDGSPAARPITALSSGERQLLIMLGHLSLNHNLEKSAVFIVDEPELSLHVAWQERFVDAMIEANPSVQYILATHSPAIILDRVESCWSMS